MGGFNPASGASGADGFSPADNNSTALNGFSPATNTPILPAGGEFTSEFTSEFS